MAKKMLTKKRLLELIKNEKMTPEERTYLEALVNLEITPFDDEHVLTELEKSRLVKEILRYNLTIKSIDSITHNYMPHKYKLEISKGPRFTIDVRRTDYVYNLISILFGSDIDITLYDRSDIDEIIKLTRQKIDELEEYYYQNYYIYFGALDSEEDKKEIERIKHEEWVLEGRLVQLEIMRDFSDDLIIMDKHISDTFNIKEDISEVIEEDKVFETVKVKDLDKIKVYKKRIKR